MKTQVLGITNIDSSSDFTGNTMFPSETPITEGSRVMNCMTFKMRPIGSPKSSVTIKLRRGIFQKSDDIFPQGGFGTGHCVNEPLVSQPLKQVAYQNTPSSDVAGRARISMTNFITHTGRIHSGHCCGSCQRSHKTVCFSCGPATWKCLSRAVCESH